MTHPSDRSSPRTSGPDPYVFAGNPLDRASNLRKDGDWVAKAHRADSSRVLPLWQLKPLVTADASPRLAWQSLVALADVATDGTLVMLGVRDGCAYFAADFSEGAEPEGAGPLAGLGRFADARGIAPQLAAGEAGTLAQARSLVDWHLRHGFCAVCGARTEAADGGYVRRCPSCAAEHFPRTDPVVIMLVCDGDDCLLGRQAHFPEGIYSALAGFLEPGETIEEAVRREVMEEAGIEVGEVLYHSSQPWPFPASLMIGCIAKAAGRRITLDTHELEDARWFSRAQVHEGLSRAGTWEGETRFRMPPPFAIAHQLAHWWSGNVQTDAPPPPQSCSVTG